MIKVGFTGTRRGMKDAQAVKVAHLLKEYHVDEAEFHHGDCKGADDEAHADATGIGYFTVAHPCDIVDMRAFTWSDIILPEKPPLDRNKDIVDVADLLIAAPQGYDEEQRSGTWSTIRYARKKNVTRIIVYPDGRTTQENPDFSLL